jgi:alpha-tubulin suppressor-like RCC1 family protein
MKNRLLLLALLPLAGACDEFLVQPADPQPGAVTISLSRAAYQSLAGGPRDAFDDADSLRVVLVPGVALGNPFGASTRLADTTVSFTAGDTVRLDVELADSLVTDTMRMTLGVMLKYHGQPLFIFVDSVEVRPNETSFAPIPLLVPVPTGISVTADRDTINFNADSTVVRAVGLFATGDSIPDDQFFPTLTGLDPTVLQVTDDGTSARVRAVAPGVGRVVARFTAFGLSPADTTLVVVRPPPPPADTAVFSQIAVGGGYACGLDSGGLLYCWGSNAFGAFGNGSTSGSNVPVPAAGGMSFVAVAAGTDHACGLVAAGSLYCWGRNDRGQLGHGITGAPLLSPVPVSGGPWSTVTAGDTHTCAIGTDSIMSCWGGNNRGQLGVGGLAADNPNPSQVLSFDTWQYVSVGIDRTCGVTGTGAGKCWGAGTDGGLGNGVFADAFTPVSVTGGPWLKIRVGREHTCGIETGGTIRCWGRNFQGQLGLASTGGSFATPQATLVQTPLSAIDPGNFHTCVVRASDGVYKCWGSNSEGQLGDGVPPGPNWLTIDASVEMNFTCALLLGGKAFCWGDGALGQLGNGNVVDSNVPVAVAAP